jgi:hypothetical protein
VTVENVNVPLLTVVDDNTLSIRRPSGGLSQVKRVRFNLNSGHIDTQNVNGQIGGAGYGTFARQTDTEIEVNFDGSYLSTSDYFRTVVGVTFYTNPLVYPAIADNMLFGGRQNLSPAVVLPRTTSRELQSVSLTRAPGHIDFGGSRMSDFQYGRAKLHATDGSIITFRDSGNNNQGYDTVSPHYYIANGTYLQLYSQEISDKTFTKVEVTSDSGQTMTYDFTDFTAAHLDPVTIESVVSSCKDQFTVKLATGDAANVTNVWAYSNAPYPYSGWTSSAYFYGAGPNVAYNPANTVINNWSGNTVTITSPDYFGQWDYGYNSYKRIDRLQMTVYGDLLVPLKANYPAVIPRNNQTAC